MADKITEPDHAGNFRLWQVAKLLNTSEQGVMRLADKLDLAPMRIVGTGPGGSYRFTIHEINAMHNEIRRQCAL